MTDFIQRISMKAVIVRDGKVLLLRESSSDADNTIAGYYQLPGGRISPGEPFADGFTREIAEETGLTVEIGQPLQVGEWFPVIKGVPHQIIAVFFACQASSDELRLSPEHDGYQWADLAAIEALSVISPDKQVAQEYLRSLTAAAA